MTTETLFMCRHIAMFSNKNIWSALTLVIYLLFTLFYLQTLSECQLTLKTAHRYTDKTTKPMFITLELHNEID